MSWQEIYHGKLCSADAAIQSIQSHQRVFLSGNCGVPKELLAALVRRAPELEDVEICHTLTMGFADYVKPEMEGHLRINPMFIGANVRKAVQEGRADFTPVLLSEFPLLFKRGILPVDVAITPVPAMPGCPSSGGRSVSTASCREDPGVFTLATLCPVTARVCCEVVSALRAMSKSDDRPIMISLADE